MGCGGSINQVHDSTTHLNESYRPLKFFQLFNQEESALKIQQNQIYLFGQTRTQRNIIRITVAQSQKQEVAVFQRVNTKHRIPKPKIKYDPIQLLYQQAQQVIPLNMYNSTSLPPFNLMFVTFLSSQIIFLCGGTDYQFWNPVKQSFIYRLLQSKGQIKSIKTIQTDHLQKTVKRQYNKFERLSFMKTARYSHIGIFIRTKQFSYIYVFGGYNQKKQPINLCERYCIQKDEWEDVAPMKISRATGFCFQFLQKIYVFGGFSSDGKRSKKIQLYNIQKNVWEILNVKLHQGLQQGFISFLNPNQIIVMGGNTEGGQITSTLLVNIVQETYQWVADMKFKGSLQKGLKFNDKIYVFGGCQPQKCQVYSGKGQQWNIITVKSYQSIKKEDIYMFSYSNQSLHVPYENKNTDEKVQHQNNSSQKYCIFGNDKYPLILQVDLFNKNMLKKSVPMTLRLRDKMGILKIDNNRYFICGGIDIFKNKASKATFIYNMNQNKTKQMPKMSTKKFQFSLCRKNQFVYCFGGKIKIKQIKFVPQSERFNLWSSKWQKISNLIYPRANCHTVVLQSSIVVYGGYFEQKWVQHIEIYDISSNKFSVLKSNLSVLRPLTSICCQQGSNNCKICILVKDKQTWKLSKFNIKINQILTQPKLLQTEINKLQDQNSKTIEVPQKQQISLKKIYHQQIYQNQSNKKSQKKQEVIQILKEQGQVQNEKPMFIPVNTIQIKSKNNIQDEQVQFSNLNFSQQHIQQIDFLVMTEDQKEVLAKLKSQYGKKKNLINQQQKKAKIKQANQNYMLSPFQEIQINQLKGIPEQVVYYTDQSKDNCHSVYILQKQQLFSFDLLNNGGQIYFSDYRRWNTQYSQKWPQLINLNYKNLPAQLKNIYNMQVLNK